MAEMKELYIEEVSSANEVKGFTKSFVKRTKDKREEDVNVKELLNFAKEGLTQLGAKTTEKNFKKENVRKVFVASNCDELTLKKINYYGKISNVDIVKLDLDNEELSQKLNKPFLVSTVCIKKGGNM